MEKWNGPYNGSYRVFQLCGAQHKGHKRLIYWR